MPRRSRSRSSRNSKHTTLRNVGTVMGTAITAGVMGAALWKSVKTSRLREWQKKKRDEIQTLMVDDTKLNIETLKHLALSPGGLLCNEFRRQLWPKLLAVKWYKKIPHCNVADIVIQHDIDRSFISFSVHTDMTDEERETKRESMKEIVESIVYSPPALHYYQGYIDVATVFFGVMNDDKLQTYALMKQVTRSFFGECMKKSIDHVLKALSLIYTLIMLEDQELDTFMKDDYLIYQSCFMEWVSTWFSRASTDLLVVARLYDAFLVSSRLFSFYVSASLVLFERKSILACTNCTEVHTVLTSAPQKHLNTRVEHVLRKATLMYDRWPPETLITPLLNPQDLSNWLQDTRSGSVNRTISAQRSRSRSRSRSCRRSDSGSGNES